MDIKKGKSKNKNELSMSVRTAVGNVTITPSKVAEMIDRIVDKEDKKTQFVLPSHDIMTFESGKNKTRRMHDLNSKWIVDTLTELKKRDVKVRVLLPVVAISDYKDEYLRKIELERMQEVTNIANDDKNNVDGFVVLGLNRGESNKEFASMLNKTVSTIRERSPSKSICVLRVISYTQFKHCIDIGVNLVEFLYPHYTTSEGHAVSCVSCKDIERLNLWDKRYAIDAKPLSTQCSCFACQNHVRAYVHHLLHTHEILARVLLYIHNLHNAYSWVKSYCKK